VHLVGFIIRIYHNAWSSECQIGDINSQESIHSFKKYKWQLQMSWRVILGMTVLHFVVCLTYNHVYLYFTCLPVTKAGNGEGRGNRSISFSMMVTLLAGNRDFSHCESIQTTSGAHPAFYSMYNEDCLPGSKVAYA